MNLGWQRQGAESPEKIELPRGVVLKVLERAHYGISMSGSSRWVPAIPSGLEVPSICNLPFVWWDQTVLRPPVLAKDVGQIPSLGSMPTRGRADLRRAPFGRQICYYTRNGFKALAASPENADAPDSSSRTLIIYRRSMGFLPHALECKMAITGGLRMPQAIDRLQ